MSDKVSLDFLGEQMLRMQSDMRSVRAEQVRLESSVRADLSGVRTETANLRNDLAFMRSDVADMRTDLGRLESRLDSFAASMDARFEQVNQTATTNLELVLSAIKSRG